MSSTEKTVRLFRNGVNQAIRIPRDFELPGEQAVLRRDGDRLIVEPVRQDRLLRLLASLEPIDIPFPDVDDDLPAVDEVIL